VNEHEKRLHPSLILFQLCKMLRNNLITGAILLGVNYGNEKLYMRLLQAVFLLVVIGRIFVIIAGWVSYRYELKEEALHVKQGIFAKSFKTVPLYKIQNIHRRTTMLHKLFHVTALTFETGEAGDDSSLSFPAVTLREAERLEKAVAGAGGETVVPPVAEQEQGSGEQPGVNQEPADYQELPVRKTVHFKANKKDLLKAAFTSLSFIAGFPLLWGIYNNLGELLNIEGAVKHVVTAIRESVWLMILTILVLLVIGVLLGIIRTFTRYGKYEISSDEENVYIRKGVLDETAFSIRKDRVQAVVIVQPLLKRLIGLAEVKLISTGSAGEEEMKANSLFPFLPVQRAYTIIPELLPDYVIERNLTPLPKQALVLRMVRPVAFWLAATAALLVFKPALWYLSPLLLVLIYMLQVIDYKNSGYLLQGEFVQLRAGGFISTTVLTKRSKVIQTELARSLLQKRLGVATFKITNRSKPVMDTKLKDMPVGEAHACYWWYVSRTKVIRLEGAGEAL